MAKYKFHHIRSTEHESSASYDSTVEAINLSWDGISFLGKSENGVYVTVIPDAKLPFTKDPLTLIAKVTLAKTFHVVYYFFMNEDLVYFLDNGPECEAYGIRKKEYKKDLEIKFNDEFMIHIIKHNGASQVKQLLEKDTQNYKFDLYGVLVRKMFFIDDDEIFVQPEGKEDGQHYVSISFRSNDRKILIGISNGKLLFRDSWVKPMLFFPLGD